MNFKINSNRILFHGPAGGEKKQTVALLGKELGREEGQ